MGLVWDLCGEGFLPVSWVTQTGVREHMLYILLYVYLVTIQQQEPTN